MYIKRLLKLIYSHLILFVFIALGFLLFHNVILNKFVWLDVQYIINNPEAQNLNLYNLLYGSSLTGLGYYRPFTAIYFSILYFISHGTPLIFHISQIILYSVTCYLFYLLLKKFFNPVLAFFLTLLVFIHPMNESIVAFISASADILSMFFGLAALLITVKLRNSRLHLFIIFSLLLLSIFSKESGILFLIAILVYILLFRAVLWKKYITGIVITTCGYLCIRYFFHGFYFDKITLVPIARLTLIQRLTNIPQIIFYYISQFLLPSRLGGIHEWTIIKVNADNFYFPLLGVLLFCFTLILIGYITFIQKRSLFRVYIFFLILFWSGISMYLQIIPLDYTVTARWFYFSMMALCGLIAIAIQDIFLIKGYLRYIAILMISIYLFYLSAQTINRNNIWKNEITLFTYYEKTDNNFSVEEWLSEAYFSKKDYPNALVHIKRSVQLLPYDNNIVSEAYIYEISGNQKEAAVFYHKAQNADNYAPHAHSNLVYQMLVRYYLGVGQLMTVEKIDLQAVKDYPNDDYLWGILAIAEYKQGDIDGAKYAVGKALILNPNNLTIRSLYIAIVNNQPFTIYVK